MTASIQGLFHSLPSDARILFVRLRSMGDCLLMTSPLQALMQEFPGFQVSVLVEPPFAACFHGNPQVKDVLTTRGTKLATAANLFRRRFDAIVNLHGGPTSLIYSLLVRGKCYGFVEGSYPWLYSGVIPRCGGNVHSVELNMDRFRWLGLRSTQAPPLYFAPSASAAEWALEATGERPYIVVHPGARFARKRWPAEHFRALGQIIGKRGWNIFVTAGPGEEDLALAVASGCKRASKLLGLTIPQLAELIRGADLFVGNDSGPMHLAAAVNTPTVAVWGMSDSTTWRPWKVQSRVVGDVEVPNDGTALKGDNNTARQSPMERVSVDQVAEAVWALLEECGKHAPLTIGVRNGES